MWCESILFSMQRLTKTHGKEEFDFKLSFSKHELSQELQGRDIY